MEQAQDHGVEFYFDPDTGEVLTLVERVARLEAQVAILRRQMEHLLPDKSDDI